MSNEPLRPGSPAGISDSVELVFGEPARPTITAGEALQSAQRVAQQQGLSVPEFLITDAPIRRGHLFDSRGTRVSFPDGAAFDRAFVLLADPDRTAKWAHDAYWVLVSARDSSQAVVLPTRLPPHAGGGPRFIVAQ
jgi:hypothetical protein